jgi:hypothetical protein
MILSSIGIIASKAAAAGGYDADAQAFFTAAGITDTTQKDAVNAMVVSLKASVPTNTSLWSKFLAIYPMVGNTSSQMMYNLKDPRNLDAAYRLAFNGSYTFTSQGLDPSGNTFANTFITPSTSYSSGGQTFGQNNASYWFYATSSVQGVYECIYGATASNNNGIFLMNGSAGQYLALNSNNIDNGTIGIYTGLVGYSRIASNQFIGYTRGNAALTKNAASITPNALNIYLQAANENGTSKDFSSQTCAFAGIATGMDAAEVAALNTIIHTCQTSLSRNAY